MTRTCPPAGLVAPLLLEECRVVQRLTDLCGRWRASLSAGEAAPDQDTSNSIDTLCMRFRALEGEVSRLLEESGWRRAELPEAVKASGDGGAAAAYESLLDAIRALSRMNLINACLLDRWTDLNRGLLQAIFAALSPTYMPASAPPRLPQGSRLSMEA